ncbi:AAA family ATPase [Saccharothrix lopnurensis]|uniref:AAA family ATPase n=1 Tax=Saccharothrix lopnurensis TaxID=1670621 RepID=A0ABW1PFF1_9PSEU
MIGRAAELARLRRTVDRDAGVPPNLVLHGDPGVGKTVLLDAGVEYARGRGVRVLGGTGYESEAQLAFAGLHQLFAPVLGHLDRVDPFHRQVLRRVLGFEPGPVPDRLAVSVASLAVLAEVAREGPVLIAVEDAHWVDHPTREVMMFLLLRLAPHDIRALFARRPLLSSERVTPGIAVLEVGPLPERDAGALLDELHPGLPSAARDRVLSAAAGNPLALAELPHAVGTDALDLLPAGASPRTRLESTYATRVVGLPTAVRTALLQTALDGDRLEDEAPLPTALTPLELVEVERSGLVTRDSTPSGLRFRHPLVRSAIVNTAAPDEVRAAHAELAELYRDVPERRVWHLAAASAGPDEEVAAEIERAALSASLRGGSGLAVSALQRAAAVSPTAPAAAGRLHRAAELAEESGQLELAQRLLDEARRHLDDPTRSAATRARIALLRDGDFSGARRLLGDAVDDRAVLIRLAVATYTGEALTGDLAGASPHTKLLHGVFTGTAGAEELREAIEALPADTAPGRVTELCRAAAWLDVLHEHREHVRGLVRREVGQGAVTHAATGYWFAAHDHLLAGEWERAEQEAGAGLDLCVRHDLALPAQDLRCLLGWLAAARGDTDSAREYSRVVEQWAEPRGSAAHLALSARNLTLAALGEGDHEAAHAHSSRDPGTPWTLLDAVEAAVRAGRREEARERVAAADLAGFADRTPRLRLHVFAARALVADADDDAVASLRAALALPRVERWPFEQARVRLALGELHRRRHRPGDARPELRRAAEVFRRVGATAWLRRAEQELRATGVAVAANPSTAELTAQQLEVAHLAASGLSNKEIGARLFLSPRTVSAHLYRIFPKLGITSRSALRDALAALDR